MIDRVKRYALLAPASLMLLSPLALGAQAAPPTKAPVTTPSTGGNSFAGPSDVKYPAANDTESRRIDMFIGDWHKSYPRPMFGSMVMRDILMHGDNYNPAQPGAVLEFTNFLSYGRLPAHAVTVAEAMHGHQEFWYIDGGEATITAAGKTQTLRKDTAVLIPEGLNFQVTNTSGQDLTAYVVDEPTYVGFKPRADVLVVDESKVVVRTPAEASPYTGPGASGHWAHVVRDLVNRQDGLANIGDIITVEINPMTLGEPHPHRPGQQEIWTEMRGDSILFLGNELRVQKPGQAFMLRPDGISVHSNLNPGDKPVKFLWFAGGNHIPVE